MPRSCLHSYGRGETPSFTRGKQQLEKVEIDWSHELSLVRIHVEQLIGRLKQIYCVLQNIIPISLIPDQTHQWMDEWINRLMFQILIKLSLYVVHLLTCAHLLLHRINLNFDYFE